MNAWVKWKKQASVLDNARRTWIFVLCEINLVFFLNGWGWGCECGVVSTHKCYSHSPMNLRILNHSLFTNVLIVTTINAIAPSPGLGELFLSEHVRGCQFYNTCQVHRIFKNVILMVLHLSFFKFKYARTIDPIFPVFCW